jgi:hypothetical protein
MHKPIRVHALPIVTRRITAQRSDHSARADHRNPARHLPITNSGIAAPPAPGNRCSATEPLQDDDITRSNDTDREEHRNSDEQTRHTDANRNDDSDRPEHAAPFYESARVPDQIAQPTASDPPCVSADEAGLHVVAWFRS